MLPSEPRTLVSWLNMFHATGNLQPSFHGSGHYVHTPENMKERMLNASASIGRDMLSDTHQ